MATGLVEEALQVFYLDDKKKFQINKKNLMRIFSNEKAQNKKVFNIYCFLIS